MNNDDFNRAPQIQQSRKPFSPNRYGNSGGGFNSSYNQNNSFGGQQHPRRRTDRFKRESLNTNDKISRQNDIIIRLLKEIRDRLPPPPPAPVAETEVTTAPEQGNQLAQSEIPQDQVVPQEPADDAAEPGNENIGN